MCFYTLCSFVTAPSPVSLRVQRSLRKVNRMSITQSPASAENENIPVVKGVVCTWAARYAEWFWSSGLKPLYSSHLQGRDPIGEKQTHALAPPSCFSHLISYVTDGSESKREKTGSSRKCNITPVAAVLTFLGTRPRTDGPDKGQRGDKCGSSTFQGWRPNWWRDGLIDVKGKEERIWVILQNGFKRGCRHKMNHGDKEKASQQGRKML